LSRLLTHPRPRIRAQAVRALHQLDAVPVERGTGLLRDPAPAVVREATTALRLRANAVPTDLAWQLLADPDRVDLRRAGYRLLRVRGLIEQLRAGLLLVNDPDAGLSRRAVADVTRLARDAASPSWRRHRQPTIDAAPAQTTELIRLTTVTADTLGAETTRMLRTWLTSPPHDAALTQPTTPELRSTISAANQDAERPNSGPTDTRRRRSEGVALFHR
jgi:hypothetical protein